MPRMKHPATGRQRIVPAHSMKRMRGDGWVDADQPPQTSASQSAPVEPSEPKPGTKAALVDQAAAQGIDRGEAEAMTKTDLQELLGA